MHVTMVRYLELPVIGGLFLVGDLFLNIDYCDFLKLNVVGHGHSFRL